MTDTLLRHIATSRLPIAFHRREDIEQIQALRAQGLLIALVPAPADLLSMSGPAEAAQVLALTQKGRAAVAAAHYIPTAQDAHDDAVPAMPPGFGAVHDRAPNAFSSAR